MRVEKEEGKKEISIEVFNEPLKSDHTYSPYSKPPRPKKFKCPTHGEILGSDILWKVNGDDRKPFCNTCKEPVEPM